MLFNLKEDPAEDYNLIDKEPDISNRLLIIIREKIKEADAKTKAKKLK
jgi:hypothetical protein